METTGGNYAPNLYARFAVYTQLGCSFSSATPEKFPEFKVASSGQLNVYTIDA